MTCMQSFLYSHTERSCTELSMLVLVALLSLGVYQAVAQTGNSSISRAYPARALAEGEEICPTGEEHDTLLAVTDREVEAILKDIVDVIAPCNETYLGLTERCPASSCNDIFIKSRVWRPSGIYWLNTTDGTPIEVHCDMTRECCGNIGGWYRIAYLNMSERLMGCPYGWQQIESPVRACGRNYPNHTETVTFSSRGLKYSRVCGQIIAYQKGPTDAFLYSHTNYETIEDPYVDGVSVTYEHAPKRHIWTFASALTDQLTHYGVNVCPCTNTGNTYHIGIPSFVGNDYFCDSGASSQPNNNQYFTADPLWDGAGCPDSSTCCNYNHPPWFCKTLPSPSNGNIEVRLMGSDNTRYYEDTPIKLIEIYVQ